MNGNLYTLSEFFKVFGDVTRLKIISTLLNGEMSVNELSANLHMEQSAISHQLRILRQQNLVQLKKEGKQTFYAIKDQHVAQIFKIGMDHISE